MAGNKLLKISSPYTLGLILAFLAYAFVTFGDAVVKQAMTMHDLIFIAFYTNVATSIVLICLAPFNGGYKKLYQTGCLKLHILRACLFFGVYLSFLYAISNMGIAQTYTLYLTQPFILAILAHFITKEHIDFHRIISILISFIGVLVVLRPGLEAIQPAALSALLCALLFASGNITVKFMDERDHWMSYVFYIMIVQTPPLALYLFFTGGFTPLIPSVEAMPWIFAAGLFYTIALGLFPLAMHRIDAAMFGALEYTVLIWGTLFGYLLFSEVPDIWTIAGAGIIVASGLYLVYRERKANHVIKKLEGI